MALGTGSRAGFSLRRGNDRFEKERERYRSTAKDNPGLAYDVFGFTLAHSLSIEDGTDLLEQFGFEPNNAVELYNRGVIAAQAENYPKAIDQFRKACEADPTLLEAIYNLAVCYERTKQISQAVSTWQTYVDSLKDKSEDEESKKTKERIATLKAKAKQ